MSSPAMSFRPIHRTLFACLLLLTFTAQGLAASSSSSSSTAAPGPITASRTFSTDASPAPSSAASAATPPDVLLNVPNLSVGRIELEVDSLRADINLNANVAGGLVSINAGVAVSVQKVNLTIVDVAAQLDLVVRLGHLVDIVNRVFHSLDLNPDLISAALGNATSALGTVVVGAVDGLLGSVTHGATTLSFVVDNLGNIVQQVSGGSSSIVGNYLTNMTATGASKTLQGGLVQKTYSYSPLNALVDIVFNGAGQVVQATVVKQSAGAAAGNGSVSTGS
ncbi:hypothetical protein LTR66_004751 [Elasticomyces elasticus]|nr:hypothetical protein LTR66_004751 [Elasticomyces elasticus]